LETENGETEFFGTETMAELCARQGRLAEALKIYQQLIDGRPADERHPIWTLRHQSLQRAVGYAREATPEPRPASAKPPPLPTRPTQPTVRPSPPAVPPPTPPDRAAWEALAQAAQVHRMPLLITQPVRSGQVVRAEKNDLIVLGPVNPGAQLVADGNIHVYGPLRGQAIAGAMGCAQARIFCQKLDAELVAINGIYLIHEDIPPGFLGGPAQVYLQDERCLIDRL
jgi:septum site-determining protein MinC